VLVRQLHHTILAETTALCSTTPGSISTNASVHGVVEGHRLKSLKEPCRRYDLAAKGPRMNSDHGRLVPLPEPRLHAVDHCETRRRCTTSSSPGPLRVMTQILGAGAAIVSKAANPTTSKSILPDRASQRRSPLGPLVRHGDDHWFDLGHGR